MTKVQLLANARNNMMETIDQPKINLRNSKLFNTDIIRSLFLLQFLASSLLLSSQCTSPITTFPVSDNFETSIGNWVQDSSDDFNWTRKSGSTGSGGTGPTSGAYGSTWYMYTEASSPNNDNKVANLISPCFTVTSINQPYVEFSYHMLGTVDLGVLNLDISSDNGSTWTTIWNRTGSQGSNWLTGVVGLDDYSGQDVQIRFSVTTNTFRCDFAIDNVIIGDAILELCSNGIDDDGDGLTDDDDPDCINLCTNNCTDTYRFDWYNGSTGAQWPISNGETNITNVYPISGPLGTYNVSVTMTNDNSQNIDLSNCGTAGNHFYTATCNDPNANFDCDGDPAVSDGQFNYDCNYLTFGITSNNSEESVSITYDFEWPSQICDLQIGDIDFQGSGAGDLGSWQDEIEIEASRNGTLVAINANVGSAVNAINNNTPSLTLRSDFDTTSGGNINQNDAAGHAYITTLEKVTSITFKYSNGPSDDGLSDDHAIRINGFDFCPEPKSEICDNGIDDDLDGDIDCEDIDCGQIENGEFDSDVDDWSLNNFSGSASTVTQDGTSQLSGVNSARIDITALGTEVWSTQLEQSGMSIEAGKEYRVYFSAKSEVSRNIQILVQKRLSPFTTYFVQDAPVAIGGAEYIYQFTAPVTESDVDLTFNLGQKVGTVWIDAVQFKETCPDPSCEDVLGESLDFCSSGLQNGDVSSNDPLTSDYFGVNYTVVSNPTKGTLTMEDNGTFTYLPTAGAAGSDAFTYERCYSFVDEFDEGSLEFNPCGSGKIVDTYIEGIEGESSPTLLIANPSDFESIIVEVWAESSCSSITIEGVTAEDNSIYRTDGSLDGEKIYRATLTNISSDGLINIVKSGTCSITSAVAYVTRVQDNGQGSSTIYASDIDLFHQYVSSGDDCQVFNLPIGGSSIARDITIIIPIHEKDNTRKVTAKIVAGNATGTGETSSYSAIGQGAGVIEITLTNVSADALIASVEICSPDNAGDSFGIGAISINNLTCEEPTTYNCCSQATASLNISSASIASSNNEFCIGDGPSILTVTDTSPGSAFSYNWSHSTETTSQVTVNPTATTSYIVTVTNQAGCTNVATTTVVVNPNLTVNVDFNGTICLESDSQLGANVSGGTGPFQFSWNGPNGFTGNSQTVDINDSGNYYVTVTDAKGCEGETSGFIYASFEPFIFSLETSVCEGETVDLEINGSNISGYAWDSNAGNANTSSVTVTPSAPSSTYIVTVTNNNGCTSTASATIGVEALPTANAGADITTCENTSVSISTTDAGSGTSYAWNFGSDATPSTASGAGPHNVTYSNPNANGANRSNIVTLTVTKGDCTNTDTKNITISAQPDPTVTFSSPSCGVDDGSITFGFVDNPNRTNVQFSINGGVTYPYNTNDNVGNYTVSGLAPGDYDLYTKWGDNSCPVTISSVTLADNTIPTITNSGDVTLCIGSTTIVNASTSGSWTSDNTGIASVSNTGVVQGLSAGIVNISFVADNNCAAIGSLQITVTDKEGVIITGEDILCEGTTTTLIASKGGGTWLSSNTSVATVNTSGVVTAINSGVVLISYDHSSNSCTENSSFVIEVFDTPTASISGVAEICVGETTNITTDGTGGYWTSSDNNIAIVSSTGLVSGIAAGNVTFHYTTGDNCPSPNTGTVIVTPAVSVAIDFNGSECLTEDSKLSAIVTGGTSGYSYTWTGPGGFAGNTQIIDITLDGNYNLTVTDNKGCTDATSAFVYESYEPFIFALNTTVCEGESVTLSVSGASATGYQWSSSAGSVTTQSVTVVPTVPSTSYTVTVTNSIGCTTDATANIMVDAKPIVSITGSTDLCVGENTQLSPITGGEWTSANSSVASVTNGGLVTGIANGSTTFTFKSNTTGCTSNPTNSINIGANGSVTIAGDNQICFSDSPTLTASVAGGSWSSSNLGVATIDANGVVTPQGQGTTTILYDVTAGGCYDDGTYTISINNDPTVSLNGPSTICQGDNTFVNSSISGTWSSSDETIATISNSGVITGISGGNVTISFVSAAGCTGTLSTPITVISNPKVTRLGPAEICINNTTSLSPTSEGVWISSDNSIASINNSGIVTGKSVGTATFTFIEASNGCISDEVIAITVFGPPTINGLSDSDLCIGETTNITPSSGGTWVSTDALVATITDSGIITAVSSGSARFTYTSDATGCESSLSAPVSVNGKPTISYNWTYSNM